MPSRAESITPFLLAKASARPSMMQFTTMSGMKRPRVSYTVGTKACIRNCSRVTKVAITTMYAGMRTLSGMKRAMALMAIFERMSTNIVARPILMPLMAEVVVARVGHIPSRSTKVGFSFTRPLVMRFNLLICLSSFCYFVLFLYAATVEGGIYVAEGLDGVGDSKGICPGGDGGSRNRIHVTALGTYFKFLDRTVPALEL